MSAAERARRAEQLRQAIVEMSIRYADAAARQMMLDDAVERSRQGRARVRRFEAIQRLTRALANLARGDR